MNIKSLLTSTRLEIITSKRMTSFLYAVFGLAIMVWWMSANYQFVSSYFTLHEFDVSVIEFIFVTLFLFAPLVILGAFMLSVLLQRIRLYAWLKRFPQYAHYESALRPAEAGLLVDYEFNHAEAEATLLDLHFRNFITLSTPDSNLHITRNKTEGLSQYETAFLSSLFGHQKSLIVKSFNDMRLINAGQEAHHILISNMPGYGPAPARTQLSDGIQKFIKAIFYFGGLVGLLNIAAYIFAYDEVTSVIYPRYPVAPAELWTIGSVSVVMAVIILSGLRPKFSFSRHDKSSDTLIQAEGFRHYLLTVYKDRLNEHNLHTQDLDTIKTILPYMVAFKIAPLNKSLIDQILQKTSV